ncbi:esterase-like activity of phytase family protein [Roseobacteraceae bacterium S113]
MRLCLAVALTFWAHVVQADKATHLFSLDWDMPFAAFGGWSGFDYLDNGTRFFAVSDRGTWTQGVFTREQGKIVKVSATPPSRLIDDTQRHLAPHGLDSEGVAVGRDGARFVSAEGIQSVLTLDDAGPIKKIPSHADFAEFETNGSLEALAIDGAGRLFTLPERSGRLNQGFPLYRLDRGRWRRIGLIPRRGGFLPVGADFGPDGRLYILERAFSGFGFRSRITRYLVGDDGIRAGETLLTTPLARHGNLESIAIWRAPSGLRATLLSDDNFVALQRTEIVEYALPD